MMMADVAPAIPLSPAKPPASYTYAVPASDIQKIAVGSQVEIPLGRQTIAGTVLRLHNRRVPYKTRTLRLRNTPPLTAQQLAFAAWISSTMHGGLGYTLRFFYPPAPLVDEPAVAQEPASVRPAKPPTAALFVEKNGPQRLDNLRKYLDGAIQALIIVPEVVLVEDIREFFNQFERPVYPYHTELSKAKLRSVWQNIYRGQSALVVGTQKALWLPWQRLTHIIIEEEHLETHKLWDQYPRLDNRDAARQLGTIHRSYLLLSGSVGSLERRHDMANGRLHRLADNPIIPQIIVAQTSFAERQQGHILPHDIAGQLRTWTRRHQRLLILHNQRGAWRSAVCSKCHQTLRCPNCGHTVFVEGSRKNRRLRCRQCSWTSHLLSRCPSCGGKKIRVFGPGAARVRDIIEQLVPQAAITAITAGVSPSPQALAASDIVLGTTALWRFVSHHTFDRALWLWPETTLLYPDYRSGERAYYLLARLQQAIPPRRRILIVTRYPELIKSSLVGSPTQLNKRLLRERQQQHLPPFANLVKLTCLARREAAVLARGRAIRERLTAVLPPGVTIRGPYQGFNKKEDGKFSVHLLLAGPLDQLRPLYKTLPIDRADLSPAQLL